MTASERQRIREYHLRRINEWNLGDPRALGYSDHISQQARFEVIASLFDFNDRSVLDVGCGDGQLKEYLSQRYTNFDYIGIDQQSEFILYARDKYKHDSKCRFTIGDFARAELPACDVVVASGALSYRCDAFKYYTQCIERFFRSARYALIVNLLDQSKMFPTELIVGHNRNEIMEFCQTLSPTAVIVTGYLPFDFTLRLSKST